MGCSVLAVDNHTISYMINMFNWRTQRGRGGGRYWGFKPPLTFLNFKKTIQKEHENKSTPIPPKKNTEKRQEKREKARVCKASLDFPKYFDINFIIEKYLDPRLSSHGIIIRIWFIFNGDFNYIHVKELSTHHTTWI